MAWQSIISSHPTTDPRSRLFRCGSIILLIDKLKVGGGPSLSSGSETADHLIHTCFCAAISRTIAALSCTRASLLSPHLHRESLPSGSKRAQRTATPAAIAVQLASLPVGSRHHGHRRN